MTKSWKNFGNICLVSTFYQQISGRIDIQDSTLRRNKAYAIGYVFWSKFILVEIIPYFTIVVLNSAIVRKIWKSNKFRRRFVVNTHELLKVPRQMLKGKFLLIWNQREHSQMMSEFWGSFWPLLSPLSEFYLLIPYQ